MVKAYNERAKKVKQRMAELLAASNLEEIGMLPAAKCHELTGQRAGELAVSISGNYRLIFEPNHNPAPEKEDGGLDWSLVTDIRILEIEDYH